MARRGARSGDQIAVCAPQLAQLMPLEHDRRFKFLAGHLVYFCAADRADAKAGIENVFGISRGASCDSLCAHTAILLDVASTAGRDGRLGAVRRQRVIGAPARPACLARRRARDRVCDVVEEAHHKDRQQLAAPGRKSRCGRTWQLDADKARRKSAGTTWRGSAPTARARRQTSGRGSHALGKEAGVNARDNSRCPHSSFILSFKALSDVRVHASSKWFKDAQPSV